MIDLTIFIKAYCFNIMVNIKPSYLKKHQFTPASFAIINKTIIIRFEENSPLERSYPENFHQSSSPRYYIHQGISPPIPLILWHCNRHFFLATLLPNFFLGNTFSSLSLKCGSTAKAQIVIFQHHS